MAESQLMCMDDDHVNEKIPESKPEFYYSEEQRAALEQLLKNGDGAFKMRLKEDNIRDFLSAREVKWIRQKFKEYGTDSESDSEEYKTSKESSADSGVQSTYWPQMSDTEVPPLDIGWPGNGGFYKGVTRVSVYSHPPKENGPYIKEVVRRLIQDANKVVAVVMDLLTDLHILQDLLDAACRRGVAIYLVLEDQGLPHFLDMCSRLQISAQHLRNMRVRTVEGTGLALSFGKLPGSLCSKYMLVDGEKVLFGSYSFTWSSSRTDRHTVTVMTGQVVDTFDTDFRELYAASKHVDLYKEFNLSRPPLPAPARKLPQQHAPQPVSTSRFQVALGDSRQADLKVPAHKYHNPKYSLVVGHSRGYTGSLQDLSSLGTSVTGQALPNGSASGQQILASPLRPGPVAPAVEGAQCNGGGSKTAAFGSKKQRSSFRLFLNGRGANQCPDTILEGVASHPNPSPTSKKGETNSTASDELEDSFEIIEKPSLLKLKTKKLSKLTQRSMSLQTINGEEEGKKKKKNCIQS